MKQYRFLKEDLEYLDNFTEAFNEEDEDISEERGGYTNNDDHDIISKLQYKDIEALNDLGKFLMLKQLYTKCLVISDIHNFMEIDELDKKVLQKIKELMSYIITNSDKYIKDMVNIINLIRRIIYVLIKRIYVSSMESNPEETTDEITDQVEEENI